MKLIIDTDPGVDDALAILFAALHPRIELVGLTSIFGNVTVKQATRNALHLAERAGLDIPVCEGAAQPIVLPLFSPSRHVHGDEGFGGLPAPAPQSTPDPRSAAAYLCEMARKHQGELIVCAVGPMTNVAMALKMDPEFASNVGSIVFMGGALDVPGNITPYAEANTYHDPHALDALLQSGARITMVGLDVTMQVLLTDKDFDLLAELNPSHGAFLKEISRFYLDFYRQIGLSGCGMHDPMAIIAALHPEYFVGEATPVEVVLEGGKAGRTRRASGRPPINVLVACNGSSIRETFFHAFGPSRSL